MNMNRISCYALALSCLLASCKDEMKDEEMPTVSITAPKADTKVWLETTLATEVMDNQGVSKVEFYLDGDLIGEATEAPYELMLDTKQYKDGTHVLRTVAYDGANNQSEAERDIEILNTLLTVDVEDNHFGEGSPTREWVMVSDLKGNVLQVEEAKDGMQYTFDRVEGFLDSLVSVTVFRVNNYFNSYRSAYAYTYYGIQPDQWTFEGRDQSDNVFPTKLGEATGSFIFRGIDGSYDYNDFLPYPNRIDIEHLAISKDSTLIDFKAHLYEDDSYIYFDTYPEGASPQHALIDPLEVGKNYDLTAKDFTDMKLLKNITVPSARSNYLHVYGSYKDKGFRLASSPYDDVTNTFSVYQPEGMFNNFRYDFSIRNEKIGYYRSDEEQLPNNYDVPFSVEHAIISTNRNDFQASIQYPHDYSVVSWRSYEQDAEYDYVSWNVYTAGQSDISFSIASLPKAITDEYPSLTSRVGNLPYDGIRLINSSIIDSLEELTKIYKKNVDQRSPETYEQLTIYHNEGNARRAIQDLPQHVQAEIKRYEKR